LGRAVKWKPSSLVPVLICAGVTVFTCLIEWLGSTWPVFKDLNRLEWITYDWRVRQAARTSPTVATNLGFVAMDNESVEALLNGSLPYRFGLLWPRQVYARLVEELSAQGAHTIGFDVLFAELRPDHPPANIDGRTIPSDDFFAEALRRSGNTILASEAGLYPPPLFASNAAGVAHITAERDDDGILRRTHAFTEVRVWHPKIKEGAASFGWDLSAARVEGGKLILPRRFDGETNVLPLNERGEFNLALVERSLSGQRIASRFAAPFEDKRLWHLGIVLAARALGLDLDSAKIDLVNGRVELSSTNGVRRVIPVDREGRFFIDWSIGLRSPHLTKGSIEHLLEQYEARRAGRTDEMTNVWRGKLIVVGSTASGNNLNDQGATPLEQQTFLVSSYWNVANAVLLDRFVQPLSLTGRLLIIIAFGIVAGLCTWKLRTLGAVACVAGLAAAYVVGAAWLFAESRVWLPIVTPVLGALFTTHVSLITYLVRVERRGRQRTREIFSRVVAPDIVRELLGFEKLSLGGARRRVTIFFADIRGFTHVTDTSQQLAEQFIAQRGLSGDAAQKHFDATAEAVLNTVNPYLSIVADVVKKHEGTLDKYIGDCVMAFWGAPVENERHAVCGVRAAIEAQRAIFEFNQQRRAENERRGEENIRRMANGEEPWPMLEILTLGSGINTGFVTVGMVGSEAHVLNYTIFGREVNLASRLEGASGRARILIGAETYRELLRDDPKLAATCREQPPLELKGFHDLVKAYEVPWRAADVSRVEANQSVTLIRDPAQREDCY